MFLVADAIAIKNIQDKQLKWYLWWLPFRYTGCMCVCEGEIYWYDNKNRFAAYKSMHWCTGFCLRLLWLFDGRQDKINRSQYNNQFCLTSLMESYEWIKYHNQEFIDGHFDGCFFLASFNLHVVLLIPVLLSHCHLLKRTRHQIKTKKKLLFCISSKQWPLSDWLNGNQIRRHIKSHSICCVCIWLWSSFWVIRGDNAYF